MATTTNPFRRGDTLYTTTYSYDGLGRQTSVTTPDGAVTTTSYYAANQKSVTDPAGHAKQIITDGLGRLMAVVEDPGGFSYITSYGYDALGDLTSVNQSGQQRNFSYDSLGRLSAASNPESGVVNYTYDNAGNVLTKTDARGIQTTYSYDALNRGSQISYSDGTPTINYYYDGKGVANSKGRLTAVTNQTAFQNYTGYDAVGNVTSSSEQIMAQTYSFSYAYNLAGSLTSEKYPSGRVVATSYDAANRTAAVTGWLSGVQTSYVSNLNYWPHGAPLYYAYGNNVWSQAHYNSRLQTDGLWAAVSNDPSKFLYYYWLNWGTNSNNGTLLYRQDYVGNAVPFSSLTQYQQSFSYDSVNRLTAASDSGGWSRSFGYDGSGNGWVTGWSGIGLAPSTPTPGVYDSHNRIPSSPYDAAGNMLGVPNYTFAYDAENRQVAESNTIGNPAANYYYDGVGQRVLKWIAGGGMTLYIYDALGQLAAEYGPAANTLSKEYIRFNAQILAIENAGPAPCRTCYLSYDHLGSVRMVTDQNANVIARHDYLPFGEEIPGNVAGRSNQFGPGLDNVNQKFTGQERDTETNLDFFQARYYGSALGRFTSPDPGNAGAHLTDPQTWNAYAYVGNNPLANVDPDGMIEEVADPPIDLPPADNSPGFLISDELFDLIYRGFFARSPFTFYTQATAHRNVPTVGTSSNQKLQAQPPKNGTFTRMPLPPNHLTCTSLGTSYVAPPKFSLNVIVKAGQASGRNLFALRRTVGQGGTFDFQRVTDSAGNVQFYGSYTPVSNFAVGAYEFGAGYTRGQGDFLSNLYATLFSSNVGDPKQELYRHLGYDAATKGDAQCH